MRALLALVTLPFALQVSTPPATPEPPVHEECIVVEATTIDWISEGFLTGTSAEIGDAWAVKSDDFENVWFVAADLEGMAESVDSLAVWGTNAISEDGTDHGTGLVISVNEVAENVTDWPKHDETDAVLSMEDHGADLALDCARGSTDD
jgi:hypothetical protein